MVDSIGKLMKSYNGPNESYFYICNGWNYDGQIGIIPGKEKG